MIHLARRLQALYHPEQYHGWGKTKKYFEGWYYKIVTPLEDRAFAIIPGIAMNPDGKQQAFIQVLDGKNLTAEYHKFAADAFIAAENHFEINLGNNFFKLDKLRIDLPQIKGELFFHDQISWPTNWHSPGIMGPYAFVPFMECYHGILSMDHSITGLLEVAGEKIDFSKGRGYMEKDWGQSFPSAYFWLQTNHFSKPGISLKASVAKIPWLTGAFVGFIAGLWHHDRLFEFTTYNGSSLRKSFADIKKVELVMENKSYRLEILAHRGESTALASPILGFMDGRINESMTSTLTAQLYDKQSKKVIFEDTGRNAGLEVAGRVEEIMIAKS